MVKSVVFSQRSLLLRSPALLRYYTLTLACWLATGSITGNQTASSQSKPSQERRCRFIYARLRQIYSISLLLSRGPRNTIFLRLHRIWKLRVGIAVGENLESFRRFRGEFRARVTWPGFARLIVALLVQDVFSTFEARYCPHGCVTVFFSI